MMTMIMTTSQAPLKVSINQVVAINDHKVELWVSYSMVDYHFKKKSYQFDIHVANYVTVRVVRSLMCFCASCSSL